MKSIGIDIGGTQLRVGIAEAILGAGALNEQASGSALERIACERFGKEMKPKELFELYYEGDKTAEEIIEKAKKYILFPEKLRVEMAEFGDDAGLMGAALLV